MFVLQAFRRLDKRAPGRFRSLFRSIWESVLQADCEEEGLDCGRGNLLDTRELACELEAPLHRKDELDPKIVLIHTLVGFAVLGIRLEVKSED